MYKFTLSSLHFSVLFNMIICNIPPAQRALTLKLGGCGFDPWPNLSSDLLLISETVKHL